MQLAGELLHTDKLGPLGGAVSGCVRKLLQQRERDDRFGRRALRPQVLLQVEQSDGDNVRASGSVGVERVTECALGGLSGLDGDESVWGGVPAGYVPTGGTLPLQARGSSNTGGVGGGGWLGLALADKLDHAVGVRVAEADKLGGDLLATAFRVVHEA